MAYNCATWGCFWIIFQSLPTVQKENYIFWRLIFSKNPEHGGFLLNILYTRNGNNLPTFISECRTTCLKLPTPNSEFQSPKRLIWQLSLLIFRIFIYSEGHYPLFQINHLIILTLVTNFCYRCSILSIHFNDSNDCLSVLRSIFMCRHCMLTYPSWHSILALEQLQVGLMMHADTGWMLSAMSWHRQAAIDSKCAHRHLVGSYTQQAPSPSYLYLHPEATYN